MSITMGKIEIVEDVNETLDVFIFFSLFEFQWFNFSLESIRTKIDKSLAFEVVTNIDFLDNPLSERLLLAGSICKVHLSIFKHNTLHKLLNLKDEEVEDIVKNLYNKRLTELIGDNEHITLQEFLGVDSINEQITPKTRQNISNLLATI